MAEARIDQLLALMARLRDPDTGCPWDLKQSYRSIAPSTLEEAYEVVDAIEKGDLEHLREELGDLLFQIVFYAQLGKEEGRFDFDAIAQGITDKLLRRHPHVFPDGTLKSRVDPNNRPPEGQIKAQWETIKRQERDTKGQHGQLADVPVVLPALSRAVKLQKRAALVGFDWPNVSQVFDKLAEELQELREAIELGEMEHMTDELGDVLFCVANIGRHLQIDPEKATRHANQKFERRFNFIEATLQAKQQLLTDTSLEDMEILWQAAKVAERTEE